MTGGKIPAWRCRKFIIVIESMGGGFESLECPFSMTDGGRQLFTRAN